MLQLHWHKDGTKSNNIDEFLDNLICYIYQLGLIVFSVSNIRHVIDEFLDNLICYIYQLGLIVFSVSSIRLC
jgi:hypothetical protein